MRWNYRTIRSEDPGGIVYAIHEVYYDKRGKPTSWTADPADVLADNRAGLLKVMAMMKRAVAAPVLEARGNELFEVKAVKPRGRHVAR